MSEETIPQMRETIERLSKDKAGLQKQVDDLSVSAPSRNDQRLQSVLALCLQINTARESLADLLD